MLKLRLGRRIVIGILGATAVFLCSSCTREVPAKDTGQINNATINQAMQDEAGQVEAAQAHEIEAALIGIWHAAPSITAGYSNLFYFDEDHTFKLAYAEGDEEKRVLDIGGNWAVSEGELTLTVTQKTVVVGGELVAASPSATSKYQIEGGTIEKIRLVTPEIESYVLGPIEEAADSPYEKKMLIDTTSYWKISNDPNAYDTIWANPFFFREGETQINYKGLFMFNDIIKQEVTLHIQVLDTLDRGTVYTLIMDPIEGVPQESLTLGYFYVQEDKIYKLNSSKESLEQFLVSESIPEGSEVICQEEGTEDFLDTEEKGWHHYIEVDGEKRIYHAYSNLVETGYYESYTWEKGKGLINYRSGYGAGRDSIELTLSEEEFLNEIDEKEEELSEENQDSIEYTDETLGFSYEIPKKWEEKYEIEKTNLGSAIYHKVNGQPAEKLMSIYIWGTQEEWEERGCHEGWPTLKIGERNDLVYVMTVASECTYTTDTPEEIELGKEAGEIMMACEDGIKKSFKFLKKDYSHINQKWYGGIQMGIVVR